ncbi:hypothetical protein M433DRAFT_49827, partial [Acidomyces richmondensis BFW]
SPGFHFMSYLHLERNHDQYELRYVNAFDIPQTAPCLILAGDIGYLIQMSAMVKFLAELCSRFTRVFFGAGKHEFYGLTYAFSIRIAESLSNELGDSLIFLNQTEY